MKLKRTYLTRIDDFAKKVYILKENDSKFWGFADFDEINDIEQLNEINACAYKTNGDVLCWVKGGNRILVGMTLLHVPLLSEDKHEAGRIPSKIYVEIEDVNVLGWLPTIYDDTNEPYVEGPNELDDIIEYIKKDSVMKNGIDVEKIEMLPLPSWQKKIVKEAASDAINDYLSENFNDENKKKKYEDLDKEELHDIFMDKLDMVSNSLKIELASKLTNELTLICEAAFNGGTYDKSTEDILTECITMIDEETEDEELSLEEELKEEILGKLEKKEKEKTMKLVSINKDIPRVQIEQCVTGEMREYGNSLCCKTEFVPETDEEILRRITDCTYYETGKSITINDIEYIQLELACVSFMLRLKLGEYCVPRTIYVEEKYIKKLYKEKDEENSMETNKVRRTKEDLLNDLIKEQNELEGKICRLDLFVIKVRNHDYDKSIHEIGEYELQFMEDQLKAMRKYLKALVARIAIIKNED